MTYNVSSGTYLYFLRFKSRTARRRILSESITRTLEFPSLVSEINYYVSSGTYNPILTPILMLSFQNDI